MKTPTDNLKPTEASAKNAAELIPNFTPESRRLREAIRDLHVALVAQNPSLETNPIKISVWDRHYFPAYKRAINTVFEKSEALPSPQDIAMIAATLAKNRKTAPDTLTDAAMRLWLSARKRVLMADHDFEMCWQDSELM